MQYRNIDKQALKENGYTVLSKITIVGTDTVFTEDDYIVDWTYEDYRYVPDAGFVGQFVERILDGNLQNISDGVILEDTEINLQLGIVNALDNDTTTWYDYGNFLVTKVEKTDTTGNYKFESADYTKKFNKIFEDTLTYPCTALDLAEEVCSQAGVELYDNEFTNSDFVISSNQYDSDATLRKVMQDIGKLAYSWVRVGEDNKVHIDFTPKEISDIDEYDELTTDEYYVSKKSDLTFGPVNKILIGMSDVEGENMYETSPDYTEETECAIKIYDNNLTNTEELRALALQGCDKLFGLTYTPIEINSVGHPWLDGDELIKLTNVDNEIIYTYPFNRKITYAGYIESTIGAEANTAQDSKYEYKSDIISNVKKTSVIVDKQEQTITGLVENMRDIILETTTKKTEEGNPIEINDAGSYPVEDFKIYGNAIQDGTPSVQNPVEIETLTSKEEQEEYSGTNIEFYNDTDNYSIENNYELEGQTTQNGTPTPSSPIPINVVTGLQEVDVCGKNLLNTSLMQEFTPNIVGWWGLDGVSSFYNETQIKKSKIYYDLKANTTYTFSVNFATNKSTSATNPIQLVNENGSSVIANISQNGSYTTFTPTSNVRVYPRMNIQSANTTTQCIVQLEVGNSVTSYEPYKSNTYEINLGQNIKDFYDITYSSANGATTTKNDNEYVVTCSDSNEYGLCVFKQQDLSLEPNTTYTFSAKVVSTNAQNGSAVCVNGGLSSDGSVHYGNLVGNGQISYITFTTPNVIDKTLTGSRLGLYPRGVGATATFTDIQLEKGGQLHPYKDYFTPIELNKISTYKDYIFKGKGVNLYNKNTDLQNKVIASNGAINDGNNYCASDYISCKPNTQYTISYTYLNVTNAEDLMRVAYYTDTKTFISRPNSADKPWVITTPSNCYYLRLSYQTTSHFNVQVEEKNQATSYEPYNAKDKWLLHKEIGKLILGNANYIYNSSNKRFYNTFSDINLFAPTDTSRHIEYIKSNCFYNSTTDADGSLFQYQNQLIMHNYSYTDTTNFKNWLSNINAYLYYVLANPTTEEITNEELINQLNSIELLDGLNNIIITSSNLPGILNINQIKYPYQTIRIKDNTGTYNDYKLLLKDVEYAGINDNRDYIYPENDKWYSYKIINKINSYNGETIDNDYISTTGELSTGATVYYVADEPNIQEIVDENILTPLNDLKNTLLYNGYNKIELLNELVDKLSITYLTDSELNASYATKSELQITANNITSTVSETTTKVNELDEKIEEVNASISEQTSTSITDWFNTSLKSLIEDLETSTNNNSNEIINIQSYIRRGRITDETSPYYNQAYIELGDSTNQTTLRILQNRIQFLTNGEETAYISNNQLYINESTILTKEKIGHWVTTEDEDGLLNTYWEE